MLLRLSAVICTYDRYQVLDGAIQSLLAQSLPPGALEIIVIDNSPDQQAAAAFGARYQDMPQLRYVLEPQTGLSNARNAGIALAQAELIAFMDDDAVAEPGWAAAILAAFTEFGPGAGAVGGPARPLWLGPRPGWLSDHLLGHISIIDHGKKLRALPAGQNIVGCNMAFDKALLAQLGGFNRQLGRVGPELSLLSNGEPGVLNAVRAAGRAIVYAPDAVVGHKIDASRLSQSWFRRRAAWQAVSDYLMEPAATAAHAPAAARYLRMVETSRTRAQPVGFFGPAGDGQSFAAELLLIRELVIATLSGGAETAPRTTSGPAAVSSAIRLWLRHFLRKFPLAVTTSRELRRLWP